MFFALHARAGEQTRDKGEQTRHHILDVAALEFGVNGYAGTSLNELIRKAELTKGGFYFHFPSKEALAIETFHYKQAQIQAKVLEAASQYERAIDQFTSIPRTLTAMYAGDHGCLCADKLGQELCNDPRFADQFTPSLSTWMQLTESLLRNAQEQGDIRKDVDAAAAARVAVAGFIGVETVSWWTADFTDLQERVEEYIEVVLKGLLPAKKR